MRTIFQEDWGTVSVKTALGFEDMVCEEECQTSHC